MTGQTGHHHIEELSVDKRQRIAQILGIWIEPQLLSLLGRGKCHIGLASQQLRSVNAQIEFLLREALHRRGLRSGTDSGPAAARTDEER